MPHCLNCSAPFTDDAQLINVAFHGTTSDPNLDGDLFWVEALYHPGINYHCFIAQVMRIARATFGQVPMVTEIQSSAWVPDGVTDDHYIRVFERLRQTATLLSSGHNPLVDQLQMWLFSRLHRNGLHAVMLTEQHRMHESMAQLVSSLFYNGELQTSRATRSLPGGGPVQDVIREVQNVLPISVQKTNNAITIEKWESISRPTRGDRAKRVPGPEAVQKDYRLGTVFQDRGGRSRYAKRDGYTLIILIFGHGNQDNRGVYIGGNDPTAGLWFSSFSLLAASLHDLLKPLVIAATGDARASAESDDAGRGHPEACGGLSPPHAGPASQSAGRPGPG
ncbi:hypothetical protein GB937_000372 [Aspergillus fischeri]|nr:hypothetical protein GB937_000372 [Aspergillus fischeri]